MDIIEEEKLKIKNNSLSRETRKYHDFIIKKLPKYESKANDKEKYKKIYNELKERSEKLKTIYNKASKLENSFSAASSFEEKKEFKREYKALAEKSKDILNKSKKDYNKLKNLLIAGGMTAAAATAVFAFANVYDDYMHSFSRFLYKIAYPTKPETSLDRAGKALAWGLKEDVDYFPY